ncbi:MAG: AAA family ATPase [Lachnospiraceae bacterium]|nr:AAA family ATPase [Lachnospiraceae bacterium]
MGKENLIGREEECQRLSKCVAENTAQLIVIYGRRRIGKTFLIEEFFDGEFAFRLTGEFNANRAGQLRNFANEMSVQTGKKPDSPKDWKEAFFSLRAYLSSLGTEKKSVVFFDELPWMDTPNSHFLSEFEYFWNSWGSRQKNLIFIVCGSATSWLIDNIENNKGGLFNRLTCRIFLEPFSLGQTEKYLISRNITWPRRDICECYMIMGGIPYYLSLLSPSLSYTENIDHIFFHKRSELWDEFQHLYHTLFSNSDAYIKIVEALGNKRIGHSRKEISDATGFPQNGTLTKMLKALENSGFVHINNFYGKKKKDTLYQLSDYYTLFYLRFLKDRSVRDERYWSNSINLPSHNTWAGLSFELLCMDHIHQIKKRLEIGGVLSEQSTWFISGDKENKGAQIDLLIDRQDRVINICEIKFSNDIFTIDKAYDAELRHKISAFRNATNTKSNLMLTMITTYGVSRNTYSGTVQREVVMDDLFC